MKVWLYEAEREGLIEDKSFYRYDTSNYEVCNVYLTENEIFHCYRTCFTSNSTIFKHPAFLMSIPYLR